MHVIVYFIIAFVIIYLIFMQKELFTPIPDSDGKSLWKCMLNKKPIGQNAGIWWGHTQGAADWACNAWNKSCNNKCSDAIRIFEPITINMNDVAYENNPSGNISDTSLNNWMSKLDDSLNLSNLSLPGTHDSMTFLESDVNNGNYTALLNIFTGVIPIIGRVGSLLVDYIKGLVRCQRLDLNTQLNAGIRAFDIRCRVFKNDFALYHGPIALLNASFDTVMQILTKFLSNNPTEFIIMRVKREHTDDSTLNYAQIFEKYWSKYNQYLYDSSSFGVDPTVKTLRGKIYVIQSSESSRGANPGIFEIQDMYNLDNNWELYNKWVAVKKHIQESANNGVKGANLYINFLSASNQSGMVTPAFVASGKSSPYLSDGPQLLTGKVVGKHDNTYEDFGRIDCVGYLCSIPFVGINYLFDEYLEKQSDNIKTGIVFMDFPGSRIIKQIINQNAYIKKKFYKPCRFGTKCSYDRGTGKIPRLKPCPSGMRDDGASCWKDTYGRGAGRLPDKASCDSGQRDDGTSCWEDATCNTWDDGYWNYTWGCGTLIAKCHDGGMGCRDDCYKTWITRLKTECRGCGCIKKTLMDRQTCHNDEDKWGGLCYPKCRDGYHNVDCCLCEPNDGPGGIRVNAFKRAFCNDDEELTDGLCYKKPNDGFKCTATICTKN